MKTTCIFLIIALVFPLSARAEDRTPGTKTLGKLAMVAILSVTAVIVKILVDRDRREAVKIRQEYGSPDRSVEFQEGFDHWRIERYGDRIFIFRNGILYKHETRTTNKVWLPG